MSATQDGALNFFTGAIVNEASASQKGTVELADDGEDAPHVAVQGNDYRLPMIVKKTSDQGTTSVSPISDDHLWFRLESNRYYHFRFVCVMSSGSISIGFRLTLTFPPAAIFAATAKVLVNNGSGEEVQGAILGSGHIVTFLSVPDFDKDYIGTIEGIIVTTSGGPLQFQFGSETGGSQVTIRRGSVGFLYDLGV